MNRPFHRWAFFFTWAFEKPEWQGNGFRPFNSNDWGNFVPARPLYPANSERALIMLTLKKRVLRVTSDFVRERCKKIGLRRRASASGENECKQKRRQETRGRRAKNDGRRMHTWIILRICSAECMKTIKCCWKTYGRRYLFCSLLLKLNDARLFYNKWANLNIATAILRLELRDGNAAE